MTIDSEIQELIGTEVAPTAEVVPFGRESAMGAYEGASRTNRELALYSPPIRSADGDILPDKAMADARVRDMARNDAYVMSGVNIHRDNIVGSMFMLNAKPNWKVLGLAEAWAEEFQEMVEAKFSLWAESPSNWPDASRMNTLTSLVRLAVGVYVMTGEVLATAEWRRGGASIFSTCIQMIDPDRLSNPYGEQDSPTLRAGVKRDWMGAPVGYYIRMAHPADLNDMNAYRWKYVPATKGLASGRLAWDRPMVIHIVEQFRPEQTRGMAQMVAALKEMKMTKNFRDITLQRAVLQATYAATIESDMPAEAVAEAMGAGGASSWAANYLSQIAEYTKGSKNLQIDGVKIPHLYPGTKLNFQPGAATDGVGEEFEKSLLRQIAASLGVSYEQLSKDYSATNYSSARAAMTETWKYMQSKKRTVADRFASIVYRLWLEEAINKGEVPLPEGAPSWYEGQNADAYSACEWIGASRGQIDELKETQAAALRMRSNLSTLEDEMAKLGKDWRQVLLQRKREKELMEEYGLVVDEKDNMMNAASGEVRESNSGEPDEPQGDK